MIASLCFFGFLWLLWLQHKLAIDQWVSSRRFLRSSSGAPDNYYLRFLWNKYPLQLKSILCLLVCYALLDYHFSMHHLLNNLLLLLLLFHFIVL